MTDEPTKATPNQPAQDASEPSGVGFAAIDLPGQQLPPAPGYAPPPPPPPPDSVYRYDYARTPQKRRDSGLALLFLGLVAFVVVLLIAGGGMIALGLGPFARPSPTLIAQASPTAPVVSLQPTASAFTGASPTPSPEVSVGPTATPVPSGDVTDALLSHIPLPIEPTCLVVAGSDTIVAIATCSADDGNIQLIYFQYASYDAMFTTYDGYRLASQIEADTGDCNNHDSWPAENGFNIGGQLAGRWLCTEALGSTQIYWTDNRLNILGQATQTVPDYTRLVAFWVHESGPNLQPFSN